MGLFRVNCLRHERNKTSSVREWVSMEGINNEIFYFDKMGFVLGMTTTKELDHEVSQSYTILCKRR